MRVAFMKAMRWWVVSLLMIVGTTSLMIAETTGSTSPVIFGVLGYGFAYVMGTLWKDMRGKLLGWGIAVFIAMSFLSSYISTILFVLFGMDVEFNKYLTWGATMTFIGLPIMTIVFKKVRGL
jgi:hypothetical protein